MTQYIWSASSWKTHDTLLQCLQHFDHLIHALSHHVQALPYARKNSHMVSLTHCCLLHLLDT